MKHWILTVLTVVGFALSTHAQEKKNKNAKVDIEVLGNCDMCKKRIEKAAYTVKGVKSAEWHAEDQTLHLIIDENRTNSKKIQEAVANAGHDTKIGESSIKATNETYNNLHHCCMYDRAE